VSLYPKEQRSDVKEYGDVSIESGGSLDIESGASLKIAGTSISASAAELNALDGAPLDVDFTIGSEAVNAINVGLQLNDAGGSALAVRTSVFVYLSDDANGDSVAGTAPDGGWAIGTDGLLIPLVTGKAGLVISEADGDIDITITESGVATWYLIVVLANGKLAASGAITFA
jgi:hypothetical protein